MQISQLMVVALGGSIDSTLDLKTESLVCTIETSLAKYLSRLNLPYSWGIRQAVTLKMSSEMELADLEAAADLVFKNDASHILVTMGSSGMERLAHHLISANSNSGKVIVIVGSDYPLFGFTWTDAPHRVGHALGKLEHLEPGVYMIKAGVTSKFG